MDPEAKRRRKKEEIPSRKDRGAPPVEDELLNGSSEDTQRDEESEIGWNLYL